MLHRYSSLLLRLVLLVGMLSAAGCQTAPVQEMSDARQAIAVARDAGAEQYAAEQFNAALENLENAEQLLGSQEYRDARRFALQAKESAMSALKHSNMVQEQQQR